MPTVILLPASATSGGTVGVPWADPSNALLSDNNRATAALSLITVANSEELRVVGFDASALPSDGTVTDVKVLIEGKRTAGGGLLDYAYIAAFDGLLGTYTGDDQSVANNIGDTETVQTFGSGLWGYWTMARVKDPTNGVAIIVEEAGVSATVGIDQVRLQITYTEADATGRAAVNLFPRGRFGFSRAPHRPMISP